MCECIRAARAPAIGGIPPRATIETHFSLSVSLESYTTLFRLRVHKSHSLNGVRLRLIPSVKNPVEDLPDTAPQVRSCPRAHSPLSPLIRSPPSPPVAHAQNHHGSPATPRWAKLEMSPDATV